MNIRLWLLAGLALTATAGTISALAGANSGDLIVFGLHVHGKPEQAVVIRPDGTGRVSLRLPPPGCAGCLQVSSDGTRLLTAAYQGKRITTAVEKLDGSGYRAFRLPGRTLNLGPGVWSTDGRRIAFEGWAAQGTQNGMYTGSAVDGSGLRRVTISTGRGHDIPLVYSPDGSWILFARSTTADDSTPADLYAVRTDGKALKKLQSEWHRHPLGVLRQSGDLVGGQSNGRLCRFRPARVRHGAELPSSRSRQRAGAYTGSRRGRGGRRAHGSRRTARGSPSIVYQVTISCSCAPTAPASERSSPRRATGSARAVQAGLRTAASSSSSAATPRLRRSGR